MFYVSIKLKAEKDDKVNCKVKGSGNIKCSISEHINQLQKAESLFHKNTDNMYWSIIKLTQCPIMKPL
jgi:hypothetical protein